MYAIVDIETTGGSATRHKITEIAVYLHDGEKITDSFHSLINPERIIPARITALTGITNEMVADAPRFCEVARQVCELTEDRIFVAHNVNFDYSFLKEEFTSLGGQFLRKKLCTVRLSRKLFPGLPSYSLGNLCSSLGIGIKDRHRAAGDALATAQLFDLLLQADTGDFIGYSLKRNSRESLMPPNLPREQFEKLPQKTGIYYFHDSKGQVIYVGKALNIRDRVASHFSGTTNTKNRQNFLTSVHGVSFEVCGSEFISLLLESHEILKHWPVYNRAGKSVTLNYGIYHYEDRNGYERLYVGHAGKRDKPLLTFRSLAQARTFVHELVQGHMLCPKLCGLQDTSGPCSDLQLYTCQGACRGHEDTGSYNGRLHEAMKAFDRSGRTFAILTRGRDAGEKSVVLVENGRYLGFGYLQEDLPVSDTGSLKDHIRSFYDSQETQNIISSFVRNRQPKVLNGLPVYTE